MQLDPRSAPPAQIGRANTTLQQASDCILAGLKKKITDPTVTHAVKVIESGKVQEITGTSADAYELYVVRLTAEKSGTKVETFSVITWSKFRVDTLKKAMSPCVSNLKTLWKQKGGVGKKKEGP